MQQVPSAVRSALYSTVHIAAKVRLNSSAWFRAIDDDDSGALVDRGGVGVVGVMLQVLWRDARLAILMGNGRRATLKFMVFLNSVRSLMLCVPPFQ